MRVIRFIFDITKPYRVYLWGMFFVVCINSIDTNVRPYLVKLLVDGAASTDTASILPNVWILVVLYGILQITNIMTWSFSDWLHCRFMSPLRIHIASSLSQRISHYSYSFFQNNLSGSITAKLNDAFNSIPVLIFTTNYQFIQFGLTTFVTLILLSQIHILFAVGLLVWVICFLSITYIGMKKVIPLTKNYAESKSKIWGHLSDYFTNMLNVKLFSNAAFEMTKFNKSSQDFVEQARIQNLFLMRFYVVQGTIVSIYILGFLLGLIYLQQQNLVSPGDFALVFMLNFKIADKLFDMSHQLRDYVTNWGTIDQALSLLDAAPEIQDQPNAQRLQITQGEIIFDSVKFQYKGTDPLFEDKSVRIKSGEKVGLVGYSGGGKSTFVNLILRLYDVSSGRILIDRQDIRDITQDSLRAAIGMIPQDPSLFHRSLMDNIRYGRISATDEEVIEAAKRAHAHEFIIKLPEAYESLVGERGVKLSGGQRQRIAIARAILKNAPILILDEATSQLDSLTERDIQDTLWELMQGKTTIVIAHRLSTLLHMDRVLVFDQGKIVEDGTHTELLAAGGLYKTLWNAQVGGFLPDGKNEEI